MAGIKKPVVYLVFMIWMEEMLFHPFIMALHHFSIVDRSLADLQFPEQTESVVMSSSIRIWDW